MSRIFKLISISIQTRLYYRTSLLFSLITPVILLLGQILLWYSLYKANGTEVIGGMNRASMFSYMLMSFALSNLMTWSTETTLSREIITGTVVSRCIRPVSFLWQSVSEMIGSLIPYAIVNSVFIFIGFLGFSVFLYLPGMISWLMFLPCFVLSVFLRIMLVEITSLLCFFTTSHLGISWTRRTLYEFFSGALIPLAMFPQTLRTFSFFTPFPYMLNIPISVLLGEELPMAFSWILMVQVFWIVIFVTLHNLIYKELSKNMVIAGG